MKNLISLIIFLWNITVIYASNNWIDSISCYGREILMPASKYKWDWGQATMLNAIVHQYRDSIYTEKDIYLNYIKNSIDNVLIDVNGQHPNAVASGHGVAFLASLNDEYRNIYKPFADKIFSDYLLSPRTSNGGVSHRTESVELWDDTIYMFSMYFFEMYRLTGDKLYLDHFFHQYKVHKEALVDKNTNLWVHGWDADNIDYQDRCSMKEWWKLTPERKSKEFWGRGNGWIFMALADALITYPKNSFEWKYFSNELINMAKILPELQDEETGLWYQLPIRKNEKGNFLESSCSAMFGYALAVGVKEGVLSKEIYFPIIKKVYYGLRKYATVSDGKYLAPSKVCLGTCIGDKEYYYKRPVGIGVNYAVGAYIMFGLVYETLCNR